MRSVDLGKYAAATIFVLNFLVLGAVGYLYAAGSSVAMESLHAMFSELLYGLVLFLGLAWMSHRNYLSDFKRDNADVSHRTLHDKAAPASVN